MARPDARKIGGLKKKQKKNTHTYKSLGDRDIGMARPDTRKLGGLKKKPPLLIFSSERPVKHTILVGMSPGRALTDAQMHGHTDRNDIIPLTPNTGGSKNSSR